MQTQCPHCDTTFRVTEAQVQAADGFVRCGICEEVFNAIEIASQHKHQASLLDDTHDKESSPEKKSATLIEKDENIEILQTDKADSFKTAATGSESGKDDFDFFNEESNQSLQHVVPDKYRDSYSAQTPSTASTILWSIGILFLTATLMIEHVWFNREQFNKVPQVQTAINILCQQLKCKNVVIRDPENIQLITRNIFSHPNKKGALMVDVTMKNNATFAQPYPVMQIVFSDVRGNTIAARRFWPTEYQHSNSEQPDLLQAHSNASISLEILDPGEQAMTYEFSFL